MAQEAIDIDKSSKHSKIIGDMGEHLVCNWLSRSKFEVALVDHTGIDVIAYNPRTKERLGITVKSRTRIKGKETSGVNIFDNKKDDRKKIIEACFAFGCKPWIAAYIETRDYSDLFLTSLENYDAKYCRNKHRRRDDWKMSSGYLKDYAKDKQVMHLHLVLEARNWFERKHT
jgi:hypothetical protein